MPWVTALQVLVVTAVINYKVLVVTPVAVAAVAFT